ncbi:xanthine dehydrogenase family protein molybdopterin-binding subunit [Pseudomonas fluorescens]|uniref:Isoquinoline 1-oxidoreductase subunit beta n=1 Tax=Pseudomonas fluorescens TaxID=294 RepID=A0A5E7DIR3_PSEFL|nr:xanthine dehydrogenase family protein molybdopterin-binding subunit [Pseudomonas fluorescens]VVO08134.1 Isoquinoline 1-oxidoreductase subunit beta [Pseudomonas fluorescens]
MTRTIENESRRRFLKGTAGLTLAVYFPWAMAKSPDAGQVQASVFEPNAFLRIAEDNSVTVVAKHLEMGQGSYTGLATIVAEELDAAWSQVRVESAPADASRYNNLKWGPSQGTGGSSAIANSWEQLRKAGASARAMLVAAAAQRWQVPAQEIVVADGVLRHPASGKEASFGQLASAAAEQPVPEQVSLKEPHDFKLIGQPLHRKDSAAKINGTAVYTQDIHLPDMLTAIVAHPPRFGAVVASFDATQALAVNGVVEVVQIPTGVAVLARDTWSAKRGRDALSVQWNESAAFSLGSKQIFDQFRKLAESPGAVARQEGNADTALAGAKQVLEAEYDFPYLAHAAMEPMNCVIRLTADGCEAWFGAQMQTYNQGLLATLFGLKPEQVRINTLYAGGSFGRRASKDGDYILETAHIVKAIGGRAPVKLVWLREDDMQAGNYRPMFHHRLRAGLDPQGKLVAWQHRLVGQSVVAGSPFAGAIKNGIDPTSVEGAVNLPYVIPNMLVDLHTVSDIAVPVQWWRAVGSTHTAFSTECFIDELAQAAGHDPVAWRLSMLQAQPRHAAVLKLAAKKAGWNTPLPKGKEGERRGRGVAVHEAFGSYVAQVAEVTVQTDGRYRVDRVVCAVDCGIAVNPDVIRAQVEGSVGFALSAAMSEAITFTGGKVDQSNFHNYPPLRIADMPRVEVHIMPSTTAPTGIGEPPVPPLAPAVVNALAAATHTRIRRLPIGNQLAS